MQSSWTGNSPFWIHTSDGLRVEYLASERNGRVFWGENQSSFNCVFCYSDFWETARDANVHMWGWLPAIRSCFDFLEGTTCSFCPQLCEENNLIPTFCKPYFPWCNLTCKSFPHNHQSVSWNYIDVQCALGKKDSALFATPEDETCNHTIFTEERVCKLSTIDMENTAESSSSSWRRRPDCGIFELASH